MLNVRSLAPALMAAAFVLGMIAEAAPADAANGKKAPRRGGYSYDQAESINTYGDSRGRYGSANSLRDPQLGRQTDAGPFDHGFFFDSGVGRNGGDAPYMR